MKFIILAGGSGGRLWPISRDLYPKPILRLEGERTLIQNVYSIALNLTTPRNIVVITNIKQSNDIKLQLKSFAKNPIVLSEPMMKNTAPAVASAISYIQNKTDEIVTILPVDFMIGDIEQFNKAIKAAQNLAKKGYIATIGVKPSYFDSGFGYIQVNEKINDGYIVEKFIEKPNKSEEHDYINKDNVFWNSGIYVGKISSFIKAFNDFCPDIVKHISKDMFNENLSIKYSAYEFLNEISIDYAIIEKISNLVCVELDAKWTDYGSWLSIKNKSQKDSKGNVIYGNVVTNKVKDSFIYSSKELVAANNLKEKIVIESEDAILVCSKDRASEINKLVKKLKDNNNKVAIIGKTGYRPWGYYTCLNEGDGWLTKLISVSAGHKLSLQSHNYRSEHWVVLEGVATVVLEDEIHSLQKGQSINIPLKAKHSLQNHTNDVLKILEVQKGDYISEDDIIRYQDMYGRIN